jgi:hypothetical protein
MAPVGITILDFPGNDLIDAIIARNPPYPQTISFAAIPSHTYGDAAFGISARGGGAHNPMYLAVSGDQSVCKIIGGAGVGGGDGMVEVHAPGTCSITASQSGTTFFAPADVTRSFTVQPAPLTVTASSPSIRIGGPVPAITPIYTGFNLHAISDSPSSLTTQATCGVAPNNGAAGVYPTTCSGATSPNYSITYVSGTLTINNAGGTTSAAPACPCSIWSSAATPSVAAYSDSAPVEVGVRFSSDVSGSITGIRFYKGAGNTGTHVGNLWSSSGQLLASATFTGETASGWQQVLFASPVSISANTTYIASYHMTAGGYSVDRQSFTVAVVNGPLHALASTASSGNGLYAYSANSTFPSNTFESTNYWVDVLFAAP